MEGHSPEPPDPTPPAAGLPWEEPGRPFLPSLVDTIKLFVTAPTEAFRRMPVNGELFRPLLYAVLVGWIAVIVNTVYETLFSFTLWQFLPGLRDTTQHVVDMSWRVVGVFAAPFLVLIGMFIWSVVTHVLLMMLGSAGAPFTATVRVQAYAITSTLAEVIPIGGSLIATVWSLVLQVIGLAEVHKITRGKAAVAVLAPFLLCCFCWIGVMMVAGAGILATIAGSR